MSKKTPSKERAEQPGVNGVGFSRGTEEPDRAWIS